jgi:hypothetical protein
MPALGGGDFYCDIYAMLIRDYAQALTDGEGDLKSVSLAARQLAFYSLPSFQCRNVLLPGCDFLGANRACPQWPG